MFTIARTTAKSRSTSYPVRDILAFNEDILQRHIVHGNSGEFSEKPVIRRLLLTEHQPLQAIFGKSSEYLGLMVYQMLDCGSPDDYSSLIFSQT